jgi:hypothetical protein
MDRRYKFIYEEDYLPIANLRCIHFYRLEMMKLKRKFLKQERRIRWEKCEEHVKKRNVKGMKEKQNLQRIIYQHQSCQDNMLIFSRKIWKFLKKYEMHLYQNGKRILFNNKTWNSINKNEGITVDWKSFNKFWNNIFLIQSFIGTISFYRCNEY